jgi:transposase InsO family protein
VGKRSRKRERGGQGGGGSGEPASTTDYTDPDGNVLTLRDSLSAGTLRKLEEGVGSAASTTDDVWQRRGELLFERLAVGWTISSLPLSGQKELLGRYRMADSDTRRWVRETLEQHLKTLSAP